MLAARLGPARIAAEPDAAGELAGLCARLPLALAITAARAAAHPAFTLAALAAELRDAARPARRAVHRRGRHRRARGVLLVLPAPARPGRADVPAAGPAPRPGHHRRAAASLAGLARAAGPAAAARAGPRPPADRARPGPVRLPRPAARLRRRAGGGRRTPPPTAAPPSCRVLDHYLHTAHAAALLLNPSREPVAARPAGPGRAPERLADHGRRWPGSPPSTTSCSPSSPWPPRPGRPARLAAALVRVRTSCSGVGYWHQAATILQRRAGSRDAARRPGRAGRDVLLLGIAYLIETPRIRPGAAPTWRGTSRSTGSSATRPARPGFTSTSARCWAVQGRRRRGAQPRRAGPRPVPGHRRPGRGGWCPQRHWLLPRPARRPRSRPCILRRQSLGPAARAGQPPPARPSPGPVSARPSTSSATRPKLPAASSLPSACSGKSGPASSRPRLSPTSAMIRHADAGHAAARDAWQQALSILDDLQHPDAGQVRAKLRAPQRRLALGRADRAARGRSGPPWAHGHHAAQRAVDPGGSFRLPLAVPAGRGPGRCARAARGTRVRAVRGRPRPGLHRALAGSAAGPAGPAGRS